MKKEMQTGANRSPRGVDDRHTGNLRIILCDISDNFILITSAVHVPAQALQLPPGNVE